MQEYVVRECAGVVEAWSSRRLQFEPKGWQVDFRRELRAALGGLKSDGGFLSARYVSSLSDRCDVENILFYNVGSGFSQATATGVQFERVYAKPPEPPVPIQGLHYHRYELAAPETPFAHWRPGELIASFADVRLPRLAATTKVSEVWQALREAPLETATPQTPAAFLVRLRVWSSAVGAAASFVKPLLDGIVSALHAHDGTFADEIALRLAGQLGLPRDDSARLLADRRNSPLGMRTLIVLRGAGIQWSPDDDRCVACAITIDRDVPRSSPTLSGEIYEAMPCHAAAEEA